MMKDLVEHFLVKFFVSVYPLGSGSKWNGVGSRIRIIIDADPQH